MLSKALTINSPSASLPINFRLAATSLILSNALIPAGFFKSFANFKGFSTYCAGTFGTAPLETTLVVWNSNDRVGSSGFTSAVFGSLNSP